MRDIGVSILGFATHLGFSEIMLQKMVNIIFLVFSFKFVGVLL
jgi:uncharacterized membrane-anchored protein YitT (DUF2179 family)